MVVLGGRYSIHSSNSRGSTSSTERDQFNWLNRIRSSIGVSLAHILHLNRYGNKNEDEAKGILDLRAAAPL